MRLRKRPCVMIITVNHVVIHSLFLALHLKCRTSSSRPTVFFHFISLANGLGAGLLDSTTTTTTITNNNNNNIAVYSHGACFYCIEVPNIFKYSIFSLYFVGKWFRCRLAHSTITATTTTTITTITTTTLMYSHGPVSTAITII